MHSLTDKLRSIESLQQTIEAHGKLPDEVLRKIEYKFRLECNYHSNKIEGGTLTKPETRSVMIGNIRVDGKPLKDIREMKGHDEAMLDIYKIGRNEKRIAESRILQFHKMIIKGATPEEEKEMEIGQWKTEINHVINYRGEKFYFSPPDEIRSSIHDLLNWLNAGLDKIHSNDKKALHPVLLAFEFHLRYLTIHPFSDGNGRTARLLTNLILVSIGYPPFWVKEGGEKEVYNRYLADIQSYGGSPDIFYGFLADILERSLKITLDAIQGEDIEDMDDWLKELQILKSSLPSEDQIRVARTKDSVNSVFEQSIKPTVEKLFHQLRVYNDLFLTNETWFSVGSGSLPLQTIDDWHHIRPNFNYQVDERVSFNYQLAGFKKDRENPFYIRCQVIWKFGQYGYDCYIEGSTEQENQHQKQYDEFYIDDEINDIVKQCGTVLLDQLRSYLNK